NPRKAEGGTGAIEGTARIDARGGRELAQTVSDKETRKRELQERYNAKALETGQRLQGEFFLRLVDEFDQLDQEWTQDCLTGIYVRMYHSGVLGATTRL